MTLVRYHLTRCNLDQSRFDHKDKTAYFYLTICSNYLIYINSVGKMAAR